MSQKVNTQITAATVRLIDEDGKDLGTLPFHSALRTAITKKMDLVEVGPTAIPPVCKIMDMNLDQKKRKEMAKKSRKELEREEKKKFKELRFSTVIAEHDVQTKVNTMRRFLGVGKTVKIVIVWKTERPDLGLGETLFANLFQRVSDICTRSQAPPAKFFDRLETFFIPKKQAPPKPTKEKHKTTALPQPPEEFAPKLVEKAKTVK